MDSNDLERERGITILSKNTAVRYKVGHRQALCSSGEGRGASRTARIQGNRLLTSSLLLRVLQLIIACLKVHLFSVSTAMLGAPAELPRQWQPLN